MKPPIQKMDADRAQSLLRELLARATLGTNKDSLVVPEDNINHRTLANRCPFKKEELDAINEVLQAQHRGSSWGELKIDVLHTKNNMGTLMFSPRAAIEQWAGITFTAAKKGLHLVGAQTSAPAITPAHAKALLQLASKISEVDTERLPLEDIKTAVGAPTARKAVEMLGSLAVAWDARDGEGKEAISLSSAPLKALADRAADVTMAVAPQAVQVQRGPLTPAEAIAILRAVGGGRPLWDMHKTKIGDILKVQGPERDAFFSPYLERGGRGTTIATLKLHDLYKDSPQAKLEEARHSLRRCRGEGRHIKKPANFPAGWEQFHEATVKSCCGADFETMLGSNVQEGVGDGKNLVFWVKTSFLDNSPQQHAARG